MIFFGGFRVDYFLSLAPLETAGLTVKITYPVVAITMLSSGSFPALEVYTNKKNKKLRHFA